MRFWRSLAIGALALATGAIAAAPEWRWGILPGGMGAPPLPPGASMSAARVALGRRLFYDPVLSRDGSLSCADCHEQARGFTDGLSTHRGVTGEMGIRNVPGLANVAWRRGLTWTDSGVATLEAQALVPMTGHKPVEMGMTADGAEVADRLRADPCYRAMFAAAYPGEQNAVTMDGAIRAIGAFERTMISFASPHDRGTASSLARKGARQFTTAGCADCHAGPRLTDDKVHYVGTAAPGEVDGSGYGGKPLPPGFEPQPERFRTPSLRNVAVTGPWLHDGSALTVETAIRRHAAGSLADVDMAALLAFMDALTDRAFLTDAALSRPAAACPIGL